jgi:HSP20 family protein
MSNIEENKESCDCNANTGTSHIEISLEAGNEFDECAEKCRMEKSGFAEDKLLGWDPILGLRTIHNTMNELVVDIFYQSGKVPFEVPWQPEINMYNDREDIIVEMSLPGSNREDMQIHATSNLLIIQGNIINTPEMPQGQYLIRERKTGHFSRSIPLPFQVKTDLITAQYRDGLLTVKLPLKKEEPTTGVKIEIE